jgi:hypothetical protein
VAGWRAHPLCCFELSTMPPRGVGSLKSEMPEMPGVDVITLNAREVQGESRCDICVGPEFELARIELNGWSF